MNKQGKILRPSDAEDAAITHAAAADPDAHELSDEQLKRMRPAREILPLLVGKKNAEALMKPRGRPQGENNKVATNVRYDRDLLEAFKATGSGWQTRMNDALREWATAHDLIHHHGKG